MFTVVEKSKNGSYFEVTPKISGKTAVRSQFISIFTRNGEELHVPGKISGEQMIEIVDPVQIVPEKVVLPYLPRERTTSQLKV